MDLSRTTAERNQFQSVLEFAESELNENVGSDDEASVFPREKWKRCAEFGVLAWAIPEQNSGTGMSTVQSSFLMEALGQGCSDNGLTFALGAQMWSVLKTISEFGTAKQIEDTLPALMAAKTIGAFAITEASSGSDAFNIKTSAIAKDEGYILNGEKIMITLAPVADVVIVFAVTDSDAGQWGLSAFLIPTDLPGIKLLPNRTKMGLRSVPFGNLSFTDCHVPATALLGNTGAGASIFNHSQSWERSLVLAPQVGAMQRLLNLCVVFSKQQQRSGNKISKYQAVSHRIANMRIRLEASRLLLYKTAWQLDTDEMSVMEAAITKTYISEAFVDTCHDAIAIHGGVGYICETGIERQLRDAIGATLYGGTVDVQRNIIARLLGL